jgi:hypothetical protein
LLQPSEFLLLPLRSVCEETICGAVEGWTVCWFVGLGCCTRTGGFFAGANWLTQRSVGSCCCAFARKVTTSALQAEKLLKSSEIGRVGFMSPWSGNFVKCLIPCRYVPGVFRKFSVVTSAYVFSSSNEIFVQDVSYMYPIMSLAAAEILTASSLLVNVCLKSRPCGSGLDLTVIWLTVEIPHMHCFANVW